MAKILTFSTLFSAWLISVVYSFNIELSNDKDVCISSLKVCKNGAKCTKIGKYEFCKCLPGTFGDDCGIIPDCLDEVVNCSEKSNSVCGYNVRLQEAECICNNSNLAYNRKTETCSFTCNETNPCENGGACQTLGNYDFCDCFEGTYGDRCEHVTSCVEETLVCNVESGAICGFNIIDRRPECLCYNGFKYDLNLKLCRATCEAQQHDCDNGAICEKIGHYNFCQCLNGTYGHYCENVTGCDRNYLKCNEDSGATCGYNPSFEVAECLCDNGLKYDRITQTCRITCEETKHYCENGATCEIIGNYNFCMCLNGTYGNYCENVTDCKRNYMKCNEDSGASCGYNSVIKAAECICKNGLKYDKNTETCRETCENYFDCQNGATCTLTDNYNFCACLNGTFGHYCENVTDCNRNDVTCNEDSGAVCGYNPNLEVAECLCENGLKYDRITHTCRKNCSASSCTNGATCKRVGNYDFCDCLEGTYGDRCEHVTSCVDNTLVCKKERGTFCGFNVKDERPECLCYNGLKYDSHIEACRAPCEVHDCENGAACENVGYYNFCTCLNGTYGHYCENVTDCNRNDVICKVGSGAICGYNIVFKKAECLCENFLEYDRRTETCREICFSQMDCQNEASCEKTDHYNFCKCLDGTDGHYCENVTYCDKNFLTCNKDSGASCGYNPITKAAECLCKNGLKYDRNTETCRETCEEQQYYCENGATCKNIGNYNFCMCLNGTYGHYCENVTDCDRDYMKCNGDSGATCGYNPSLEVAECLCENDLKYDRITQTCRKTCDSTLNTCANGASCGHVENVFGYHFCICHHGTYGDRCEYVRDCESQVFDCNITSGLLCGFNVKAKKAECICEDDTLMYDIESEKCLSYISSTDVRTSSLHHTTSTFPTNVSTEVTETGFPLSNFTVDYCNCGIHSLACVFDDKGRKLCGCKTGYFQRNDTCSEMCTNDKDCQNGGICAFENNGYFCKCKYPFKGDRCEINEACEHLSHTCSTIGGICQYIEPLRKGVCVCPSNRYFNDKSNKCEDKYESDSSFTIVLCVISGSLLISAIILVIVLKKFRSSRSKK